MKAAKKIFFDLPGFGRVHAMSGGSIDMGGHNREMKKADTGIVGYTEEPIEPTIKFKIARKANDGLSARKLSDLVDVNVTVIDDLGNTYIVRNACTTKPVSYSDGDFDVEMAGESVEEVN